MSDEAWTSDDERRRLTGKSEPVPEADALEQTEELESDDDEEPSILPDVPEAERPRPGPNGASGRRRASLNPAFGELTTADSILRNATGISTTPVMSSASRYRLT